MSALNLSFMGEVSECSAAVAAGVTTVNGATVDMQGYEAVLFICKLGTVTATGVVSMKAQGGAASNGSDAADLTGATTPTLTAVAAELNQGFLLLDVIKPRTRYVRPVVPRTVANTVIENITAIRYGRAVRPVPQAAAKANKVATF